MASPIQIIHRFPRDNKGDRTAVPVDMLNDNRLSTVQKAVFILLASKPSGTVLNMEDIWPAIMALKDAGWVVVEPTPGGVIAVELLAERGFPGDRHLN